MSSSVINNTSSPSNLKKTQNQPKSAQKSKSLSREFFSQLIKLEADFHNKLYTVSTLDELIQNYAKAVEYYDSIKDEISSYFMFKIQDILATKRSLKMLFDQNRTAGRKGTESVAEEDSPSSNIQEKKSEDPHNKIQPKETQKEIGEESSGDEDDDMRTSEVERKRRARKKIDRNMRVSISVMKNEKQRFFNFYYKMETQKANEKLNMNTLIDTFDKSSDKNDEFIKKDVDHQRERLRKRLEKRVTENLANQTTTTLGRASQANLSNWDEHREIEQTQMIRQSIIENWENQGAKILEVDESHSSETENNLEDFHDPNEESSPAPNRIGSNKVPPFNQENNFAANDNGEQEDDEPDVI